MVNQTVQSKKHVGGLGVLALTLASFAPNALAQQGPDNQSDCLQSTANVVAAPLSDAELAAAEQQKALQAERRAVEDAAARERADKSKGTAAALAPILYGTELGSVKDNGRLSLTLLAKRDMLNPDFTTALRVTDVTAHIHSGDESGLLKSQAFSNYVTPIAALAGGVGDLLYGVAWLKGPEIDVNNRVRVSGGLTNTNSHNVTGGTNSTLDVTGTHSVSGDVKHSGTILHKNHFDDLCPPPRPHKHK